jgi:hypothetical protein
VAAIGGVQICLNVVDDFFIRSPHCMTFIAVASKVSCFFILSIGRSFIGGDHGDLVPLW